MAQLYGDYFPFILLGVWCAILRISALLTIPGFSLTHYNFARIRRTLRVTLAMAAGVIDRLWSMTELVEHTTN